LTELSDERLIKSCLEGNKTHARFLYERYALNIERFIAWKTGNSEAAKDLVQQTFMRAFNNLNKYKKRSSFKTWLFTIAKNACYDHFRKLGKEREMFSNPSSESEDSELLETSVADTTPGPEDLLYRKQCKTIIKEALNKLSEKQETVILLQQRDFSHAEISEITGDPKETVATQIFYAREKLRKILKYCKLGE
jgi:RNA polymerase sigma factor, sigma-70 family